MGPCCWLYCCDRYEWDWLSCFVLEILQSSCRCCLASCRSRWYRCRCCWKSFGFLEGKVPRSRHRNHRHKQEADASIVECGARIYKSSSIRLTSLVACFLVPYLRIIFQLYVLIFKRLKVLFSWPQNNTAVGWLAYVSVLTRWKDVRICCAVWSATLNA